MRVTINETIYLLGSDGVPKVVRAGTVGIERENLVLFHDTMKTSSVGFTKEYILSDKNHLFAVTKGFSDREVSVRDVINILQKELPDHLLRSISDKIEKL